MDEGRPMAGSQDPEWIGLDHRHVDIIGKIPDRPVPLDWEGKPLFVCGNWWLDQVMSEVK